MTMLAFYVITVISDELFLHYNDVWRVVLDGIPGQQYEHMSVRNVM